jgi:hypothetical protein
LSVARVQVRSASLVTVYTEPTRWTAESAELVLECTVCTRAVHPDQTLWVLPVVGGMELTRKFRPSESRDGTAVPDPLDVTAAAVRPELRRKCSKVSDIELRIVPEDRERYAIDLRDGRYQAVPVLMQQHARLQGHQMTVTTSSRIYLSFEDDGIEVTAPQ